MADYIKRDRSLLLYLSEAAYDQVQRVPAADVVVVIRCKDCKHRARLSGWCRRIHQEITDDEADAFYCAYGERRNDD